MPESKVRVACASILPKYLEAYLLCSIESAIIIQPSRADCEWFSRDEFQKFEYFKNASRAGVQEWLYLQVWLSSVPYTASRKIWISYTHESMHACTFVASGVLSGKVYTCRSISNLHEAVWRAPNSVKMPQWVIISCTLIVSALWYWNICDPDLLYSKVENACLCNFHLRF